MIVRLEIENIGPYTDRVIFDFTVNKRDKDNLGTIYTLPDGVVVTKVAGIIAGNAYGKTTVLDALNAVGGFISNPIEKKAVNKFASETENEDYKKFLLELDMGRLFLLPVNKSKSDNIGEIKVEMYIETDDDYSGYYIYKLKYDNNYAVNGVIEESLSFKKKYNSKIEKQIFSISGNQESEVGYKIAYKPNILNDLDLKNKMSLEDKIKYYETFYKRYVNESSTIDAENYIFSEMYIISEIIDNNIDFVKKFINLADSYVKELEIDKSDSGNYKLFFNYGDYKLRYGDVSTATKKLCGIATNFLKACRQGGIFTIDELDNSLNKNIAKYLIGLYNTKIKDNTSQLIFTTNNPDMLDNLRRDQIFIIERENRVNNVVKYLNFIDKKNNKKSRKDWSFSKAYNDNVIKNYPTDGSIEDLNDIIVDI